MEARTSIISINPTTEEELGRVETIGRDDIDRRIQTAREAQKEWAALSIRERQQYLAKLGKVILKEKDEIAELISLEQGKPLTEAYAAEIVAVLAILKDLTAHAHKVLKPRKMKHEQLLFAHKKSQYRLEPYGVVAVISPWNYPFSVPVPEIAAALVAGNVVLFKPAPDTVLIGQKIDELFAKAGFPDGVMNTVFTTDHNAPHITNHPGVDKIIFTGSSPVGRDVMCAASHQMTPVVLELGGKDPAIVAADADLKRAARGVVWGTMFNAGQVCAGVERVYVEKIVANEFIDLCLDEIKNITCGNPLNPETQLGPLTNLSQIVKVQDQVEDALRKGAKLLHGGRRPEQPGYFFEPTLLTNVDHSMAIMVEETFGPVLPIMAVDNLDEAIRLANDSIYGLSAYVWTSSTKFARRCFRELQAGTIMINDSTSSWGEPNAPWGGYKMSGIGRTRARFGLEQMVQVKYTSYDRGANKQNIWWYPYNVKSQKFMADAMELLYAKNVFKKLAALGRAMSFQRFFTDLPWGTMIRYIHKIF